MPDAIERLRQSAEAGQFTFGQVLVQKRPAGGFVLLHREDHSRSLPATVYGPDQASALAKYDDKGDYRPLKTAPNLRRGWRIELSTFEELCSALDQFYPGRLGVFASWKADRLQTTPLRHTLDRQSGIYRVAAQISDDQINDVVADFCRSDGGCLRTILWKRDAGGTVASTKLPPEKFDSSRDQAAINSGRVEMSAVAGSPRDATIPLLCQEACNLLVAECRRVVKAEKGQSAESQTIT